MWAEFRKNVPATQMFETLQLVLEASTRQLLIGLWKKAPLATRINVMTAQGSASPASQPMSRQAKQASHIKRNEQAIKQSSRHTGSQWAKPAGKTAFKEARKQTNKQTIQQLTTDWPPKKSETNPSTQLIRTGQIACKDDITEIV